MQQAVFNRVMPPYDRWPAEISTVVLTAAERADGYLLILEFRRSSISAKADRTRLLAHPARQSKNRLTSDIPRSRPEPWHRPRQKQRS